MPKKHFVKDGPTPNERKWARILAQWRSSGQNGREFCRQRQLGESTFRHWVREIAERQKKRKASQPEKRHRRTVKPMNFVPARLVQTPPTVGDFEIVLSSGRSLRVQGDFEPALLRKLIATLEAR